MIRGLYSAAAGLGVQQEKLDVVSHNLANVSTAGYKKDTAIMGAFFEFLVEKRDPAQVISEPEKVIGSAGIGAAVVDVVTNLEPGPLQQTGNATDFAIAGDGFFNILLAGGQVVYTRDGSFKVDAGGNLVTSSGDRVLGENGPIVLSRNDFLVRNDGAILSGGNVVDRMVITGFGNKAGLKKAGNNYFSALPGANPVAVEKPAVKQGCLEKANTDLVGEMTGLIEALRLYQLNQRILRAQDELLAKAVTQIGTVK